MPNDYAEQLRKEFEPEEMEEESKDSSHHMMHRTSSMSNSSEMSFRNSARGSDSDATEALHGEVESSNTVTGSKYLEINPNCSFEEMLEKARGMQDGKEKAKKDLKESRVSEAELNVPGCQNNCVTLMIYSCLSFNRMWHCSFLAALLIFMY